MSENHNKAVKRILHFAHAASGGQWRADTSDPDDVVIWCDDNERHGGLLANVGEAITTGEKGEAAVAFDLAVENARYIEAASPKNLIPVLESFESMVEENQSLKEKLTEQASASDECVLRLNKYQRDNLLWLLNACGYPAGQGVEPFTTANNGDWLGEIARMLAPDGKLSVEDRPNMTHDALKRALTFRT